MKNYITNSTSFIIILIFTFFIAESLYPQTDFAQITNQPVLDYGVAGEWDDGSIFIPTVIVDGDTLRMWYSGFDDDLPTGKSQIGYAWSTDGIQWNRFSGNPVLKPDRAWEAGQIVGCAVIKDGATFKMWYGGGSAPTKAIGYATSSDGINWNKHSNPVLQLGPSEDWDGTLLASNSVIKDGDVYKMWYYGGLGGFPFSTFQIGMATSNDGINWVKYDDPSTTTAPFLMSDPIVKVGPAGSWDALRAWSPFVLPTETGYEMWYTGTKNFTGVDQKVGYATSSDGIAWTKWPSNPILTTNPNWGFDYFIGTVLRFDGLHHMWYSSFDINRGRPRVGYATSPIITVVESPNTDFIIKNFRLSQNFPNPFNPETKIQFEIPKSSHVEISIYNMLGQKIRGIVKEELQSGSHVAKWDGRDDSGKNAVSGIYLYKIQAGEFVAVRKMILVR